MKETLEVLMTFMTEHWLEITGLIIGYFGLVVPILQYLNQRKLEEKDKRFLNYHRLIKGLVEPENENVPIMLDRQIATVFELRNFPNYFPLTARILLGAQNGWAQNTRLKKEIELTLDYIKYKRKPFLIRLLLRLQNKTP